MEEVASARPLLLDIAPSAAAFISLPGGWNHTSFDRRAPSALRGNPSVHDLRSSLSECPLSYPRAWHTWEPFHGPSGLSVLHGAHIALDGLVLLLDEDQPSSTDKPRQGSVYSWAGPELMRMLTAASLAIPDASGLKLSVPGGLRSLRVQEAVQRTLAAGHVTPQSAKTADGAIWEWFDYPKQFPEACPSGRCASGRCELAAVPVRRHSLYNVLHTAASPRLPPS